MKHTLFLWTSEHTAAFEALKEALMSAPILAIPNFARPFEILTDACATGIGAVLSQQGHPLAYLNKALGPKNQGLSTYEKEYMVIILAVAHWRSYLQLAEFIIYTDHKSLAQLNEQCLNTFWQQKVYSKLAGLQYRIVYKKGTENGAADALSCRPHLEYNALAISLCTPAWIQEVEQSYKQDPQALSLLEKLALCSPYKEHFTLKDGIIRYKGKIWIGQHKEL